MLLFMNFLFCVVYTYLHATPLFHLHYCCIFLPPSVYVVCCQWNFLKASLLATNRLTSYRFLAFFFCCFVFYSHFFSMSSSIHPAASFNAFHPLSLTWIFSLFNNEGASGKKRKRRRDRRRTSGERLLPTLHNKSNLNLFTLDENKIRL